MKKIIKKANKKVTKEAVVTEEKITVKKMSKKTKMVLIGLLILLALIGGCFYKFGVVATVNGKPIYRMAYIQKLQKADTTVLNQMVQDALISGEAKNKGVVISKEEIDASLKEVEDQVKQQGSTLDEALKSENLTREDLISQIRTQKIAEKLASPSAGVTQEQIDEFLKTNKDYLPTGKTKDELEALAKQQLETQAKNSALGTWFNDLKASAKIIYR